MYNAHIVFFISLITCLFVCHIVSCHMEGCINDTKNVYTLLTETYGWEQSCIKVLTDDLLDPNVRPTRANIILWMRWLAEDVRPGDVLFFFFSGMYILWLCVLQSLSQCINIFHVVLGHGQQKPDPNGYEEDGMNECILPMDFTYSGEITDDLMNSVMIRHLPSGVKLMTVMDCCHSGTGLDLPFQWNPWRLAWREETNPYHTKGDVQLISGCVDEGVACDSSMYYNSPGGALTHALCTYLRQNPCPTYPELLDGLTAHIKQAGYRQRPVLSSSQGMYAFYVYMYICVYVCAQECIFCRDN